MLLLICCLCPSNCLWRFCVCLCLVCIILCPFKFSIILKRKRELVALLLLSYECLVTVYVLGFFITVPWVGLQCVIAVLIFLIILTCFFYLVV